jgi:hypothetical protein
MYDSRQVPGGYSSSNYANGSNGNDGSNYNVSPPFAGCDIMQGNLDSMFRLSNSSGSNNGAANQYGNNSSNWSAANPNTNAMSQTPYPNNSASNNSALTNSVFNAGSPTPSYTNPWALPANAPPSPQGKSWRSYYSLPGGAAQTVSYNQSSAFSQNIGQSTYPKPISIDAYIGKIEERLLRLHDIDKLGSLDMDYFSEQLMGIKKNFAAMLSVSGHLSSREQYQLIGQLSTLEKELSARTALAR